MWSIHHKADMDRCLGTFITREDCIEYIEFKKEQMFFETGNMDESNKKWDVQNFVFDNSFCLNRNSILSNFPNIELDKWS